MKAYNTENYTVKHTILENVGDAAMMATFACMLGGFVLFSMGMLEVIGFDDGMMAFFACFPIGLVLGLIHGVCSDLMNKEADRYIEAKKAQNKPCLKVWLTVAR